MQPTPESTPSPAPAGGAPPVVGESLVDFVRADRQRTAYILLGISALLLAVGFWAGWTAQNAPAAPEKPKTDLPLPPEEEPEAKTKNPSRTDYYAGAVLALMGMLITAGSGGWLLVSLPPTDPAKQKTQARAVILGAFGLLGAVIIIAGGAFFYLWSSSLFDWLDKGQAKQAKYVLGPLLAVAIGGLLMFLAIQPARAEERDNRLLRQCIYGANLGLSVLLVFVGLIVANMIIGPRLPNKLDVTDKGFYTLAEGSKEMLGRMPEPVKAYAVLADSGRTSDDIRRLLRNCEDASGGKFTVKFVNPTSDQSEYRTLAGKYPVLETNEVGVLLTVGEDEKRHSFLREDEFTQTERGANPREQGSKAFVGESRLMRELLFLGEGEKAVVYFTQSAGELDIEGGEDVRPTASGRLLKDYLVRNNLEVKPLKFDAKDPKVPGDAAVVIVAEPQVPLQDAHAAAIRKYMTENRPGNPPKKGKLIVLAGARFGPNGEVLRTGLEGLFQEFNVTAENKFVMSDETREFDLITTVALIAPNARQAKNPVAIALSEKAAYLGMIWRPVAPAAQAGPAYRVVPLLGTMPGRRSWFEDRMPGQNEINRLVAEVLTNPEVMRAKRLSDSSRSVGVAVSDAMGGDSGRMVVIGNGRMASDAFAQQAGGEAPAFELIGGSVDWLRDRPTLNIEVPKKQYVEVKFPATTDENRGLFLPLLLSVTAVGGLGLGVWMVRRRAA